MNKKLKKGFTIVELIIVMAILGILMLIAVPVLGKYMDQAKEIDRMALLDTTYTAAVSYYSTNESTHTEFYNPSSKDLAPYINSDIKIASGTSDAGGEYSNYCNKYGHFLWDDYDGADKEDLMCVHIILKGGWYHEAGIEESNPAKTNMILIEMYNPKLVPDREFNSDSDKNIKYYMMPF